MTTSPTKAPQENKSSPRLLQALLLWGIVIALFLGTLIVFRLLPDSIPTHWNFQGDIDAWSPKWPGAFIAPFIALIFVIIFPLLEKLDPNKKNYPDFQRAWFIIQLSLVGFMAYTHVVSLSAGLYPSFASSVGTAIVSGIGVLFIILGNVLGKVRQNWFIGLKTPWTLKDPNVWQKSQRVTGWAFVVAGIVTIINALLLQTNPFVFFCTIGLIVLYPIIYSYALYQRIHKQDARSTPNPIQP